ncbi:MAG: chromosome segregation protein SMC [Parvibaculales bacterium]
MKFSKLRLSGFKSFVDPVDLDILPGLTGVVGPNGCGKSNLLEALRWVMGETSYKSMRGSGMEDVIFSGTNTRPARNFAEVALVLDNQEHTAPPEYNDEELIEVIRRIERDDGSAYKINSKDVRARDVQLMFADASTGARSPALVKQGQIGELINAKPEARRKILEEAAGISGLHTRRHDAELKLRGAESNLEKLDDALGNMETQLRSLQRQARQAKRYRNLSGQIREVEALFLHLRWQQAVDAAQEASQALREAEQAVAALTGKVSEANTTQLNLQAQVPPLREEEVAAAAALRRLIVERDGLEKEEQQARETMARLAEQLQVLEQDKAREQAFLQDAQAQYERRQSEYETLNQADTEAEEAAEQRAAEAVASAETVLADAEAALDETNRKLAERRARLGELAASANAAAQKQTRIQTEQERLVEERENLLADHVSEDEKQGLMKAVSDAEALEQSALDVANQAQEDLTQANLKLDDCLGPEKEAQAVVDRLVGERAALSAMFAKPDGPSWPSLIDSVSVEAGFETALGAVLGDDLDASADTDAPAHWRKAEMANQQSHTLPEGVKPLSDFVKGAAVLSLRLGQIGVVDKEQGEALRYQLAPGQRLVSPEGDVWRWDGYCVAADAPTPAAQRLEQRNRLNELEKELQTAQNLAQSASQAAAQARDKARAASDRDNQARTALRTAQAELAQKRQDLADLERGAAKHVSRLAAIEEAFQRLTSDLNEVAQNLSEMESQTKAIEQQEDPSIEQESRQIKVAEARAELAARRTEQTGLTREREARENRLTALQTEMSEWQNRLTGAQSQLAEFVRRETSIQAQQKEAEKLPETLAARRLALVDTIETAEKTRQEAADALAVAETQLAEADKMLRSLQSDASEARELKARLEATLEGNQERVSEWGQRIRETLQVAPEEALAIANHNPDKPFPNAEEIETKLERYRRERENLGGVNLRAEEEATEIAAQIEELSAEKEDLTQAINKLRHGIGQLNREGRERLLAAFDTVNGHFKRLFTQLFGGGTAELKFTESDDPLQAGLEIIAHPPGKKPQVMSLLSGGEQALTAMSLIFAVFLTNPSPICVLDEVDAPLDDANVERFCNMISEIAESTDTRFLLITHHALTMARVDRLFGVTMQERGVSQLISVDLATAEQFAETGGNVASENEQNQAKTAS